MSLVLSGSGSITGLVPGGIPSEDLAYTPAGTGAVTTTVQTKLRESVSVKDFGAVGDGVTDDTAAIQAALGYSASTGKTIYAPAGTYLHTGLTISNLAKLIGDGPNATILKNSSVVNDSVYIQYNNDLNFKDYWQIEGLTVDCVTAKSSGQSGLRFNTCRHGVVRNVIVKNHWYNIREKSSWSNLFDTIHSVSGEYMWWVESGVSTGGVPNVRLNINGDTCTYGVDIAQNGLCATEWFGGSIEGMTNWALRILGNTNRSIGFYGVNFEANNNASDGFDVVIGDDADASSAPSTIVFRDCLFNDTSGSPTRIALDMNRGSGLAIEDCFFINYSAVASVSSNFGTFSWRNLKGVSKFSDTTNANTTYPADVIGFGSRDSCFIVNSAGVPTVSQSSSANRILTSRRHTESYDRFGIDADGKIGWHNFNTSTPDTTLTRVATKTLGVADDNTLRTGRAVTGSRPSASTVGSGSMFYDTTLSKPIFSDGTNWRDAAGSIV